MLKFQAKNNRLSALILLLLAAAAIFALATQFLSMREVEPIYPGPGVTEIKALSDWYPGLKGTAGDTEVYVLEGKKPGASMLVLGGTHPNEPSGLVSAILLIENAVPEEGTLYVIPRTNNSAMTCTDPQEGAPMRFTVHTPNGDRWFRFGSRATNPIHQWPDPEIYVHASSGQQLSGSETRNINRSYPGRPDGNFTEKMSYGVAELVRAEKVTATVDLHEASPEYPTINAIVAHEAAMPLASQALINMQIEGMNIGLEPSPKNLHGLTHRELGDYTDTLAVLMESTNPSQGRLRGKTDEALVVEGKDEFYVKAAQYGRLYVPFDENGHPLSERVARHVTGVAQLAISLGEIGEGNLTLSGVPSYSEMVGDIGPYLVPKA
ncbi:MAG: succinylglutamate desuccinylase [Oscillospiraceae bacterium]